MQNSVAQCFLLSVGAVIFSSCLRESTAQLEHEETYKGLQLEALKSIILEYLGMDANPGLVEELLIRTWSGCTVSIGGWDTCLRATPVRNKSFSLQEEPLRCSFPPQVSYKYSCYVKYSETVKTKLLCVD